MPFLVVGRDPDTDRLSLVTDEAFSSRKEAMKALSNMPPETVVAYKDHEVFLVDLKQAAAVIMVAPGGKSAEEVEAELAGDEGGGLADALARAADVMESEGITPPDSVGPEKSRTRRLRSPFPEFEPEADTGPLVDQAAPDLGLGTPLLEEGAMVVPADDQTSSAGAWPWEGDSAHDAAAPVGSPAEEEEAEAAPPAEAGDEPPVETGDEPSVEAEDVEPVEDVVDESPAEAGEVSEEPSAEPAEPEVPETAGEAEAATVSEDSDISSVIESLEEPAGGDEESLIRALGDEATLEAASRAVIMGDYGDDAPHEPSSITEETSYEPAAGVAAAGTVEAELPASEAAPFGASTNTCDECVYENTCPKAHEGDPSSCGSFQWKTL